MDIQTVLSLLSWISFALIELFTSNLFQKSGSRMSVFCSSCLTKGVKYLSVPPQSCCCLNIVVVFSAEDP